jgi:hypothetical protein
MTHPPGLLASRQPNDGLWFPGLNLDRKLLRPMTSIYYSRKALRIPVPPPRHQTTECCHPMRSLLLHRRLAHVSNQLRHNKGVSDFEWQYP